MNVHGYKLKHKGIVSMLRETTLELKENRKAYEGSMMKMKRLQEAKASCKERIERAKKFKKIQRKKI